MVTPTSSLSWPLVLFGLEAHPGEGWIGCNKWGQHIGEQPGYVGS